MTRGAANFSGRGGDGWTWPYRIGSSKLVYKEVVEVRSDYISYKKSYFWWFGNPAYGDSTGINQIEKGKVVYLSPRLV